MLGLPAKLLFLGSSCLKNLEELRLSWDLTTVEGLSTNTSVPSLSQHSSGLLDGLDSLPLGQLPSPSSILSQHFPE